MRLFLVRHGETKWNREEVFRGRIDVELSERGIEQARLTARALAGVQLAAVYAGPLSRARETARIIAGPHGLPVVIVEGLNDLDYGSWQGLSHQEVRECYPDVYWQWVSRPHAVRFEGGESLDDARRRAVAALEEIAARHRGQNVVAVSHRVINKILLLAFLGLDNSHFWEIKQDTCAVNIIEFHPDRYVICRLNDTCHINPLHQGMDAPDF
ncbi:phosphoglycerate mutase [Thermacetogenium phaeum DSM 12270]|uniref:Phosphoglycerate mutase n=1 Tax=Thermacetogenium phaeum (strain ATCC BAA-254 / DSM 26808 / PB) TaxID=1089553 RepID=K4LIK7_THEPS|nr:histidine phosphatase family protein [Thermacetogenium phaeum]AFV12806.1 phosphoglycerate mutase [Thermacetogenium phaeum DSM 12270]